MALTPRSAAALGLVASHDGAKWLRPGDRDPSVRRPRPVPADEEWRTEAEVFVDDPGEPIDHLIAEEGREARLERSLRAIERQRSRRGHRSLARYMGDINANTIEAKEEREESTYAFSRDREAFPVMRHLLGLGAVWPVVPDPSGACGACHGAELRHDACCLWCGRSGQDFRIRPLPVASPKLGATGRGKRNRRRVHQRSARTFSLLLGTSLRFDIFVLGTFKPNGGKDRIGRAMNNKRKYVGITMIVVAVSLPLIIWFGGGALLSGLYAVESAPNQDGILLVFLAFWASVVVAVPLGITGLVFLLRRSPR